MIQALKYSHTCEFKISPLGEAEPKEFIPQFHFSPVNLDEIMQIQLQINKLKFRCFYLNDAMATSLDLRQLEFDHLNVKSVIEILSNNNVLTEIAFPRQSKIVQTQRFIDAITHHPSIKNIYVDAEDDGSEAPWLDHLKTKDALSIITLNRAKLIFLRPFRWDRPDHENTKSHSKQKRFP